MAKIQSLLTQAAVIRDATAEGENTAIRVGSMFVSLIQAIVATLPTELLDATGISYSAGESNFIITFNAVDDDGTKSKKQIIIPAASQGNAGLLTPAKLKEVNDAVASVAQCLRDVASATLTATSAKSIANTAKTTADTAKSTADTAKSTADDAKSKSEQALSVANAANARSLTNADDIASLKTRTTAVEAVASDAQSRAKALEQSVGALDGIAPLGDDGKVPAAYLPSYLDDVIDFDGMMLFPPTIQMMSVIEYDSVFFNSSTNTFVFMKKDENNMAKYYGNAFGADVFGTAGGSGRTPVAGKVYVDRSTNKTYRWSGSTLVTIGSDLALGETDGTAYSGAKGKKNREDIDHLKQVVNGQAYVNANALMGLTRAITFVEFTDWLDSDKSPALDVDQLLPYGAIVRFLTSDGWRERRFLGTDAENTFQDATLWEDVEEGAAVGNCYNVTVELPKTDTTNPYYDLASAVEAVMTAKKAKLGLQITFAASASSWKMYQYTGASLSGADFLDTDNWLDMAGTSAGDEAIVNINDLCGEPKSSQFYTLASARDALATYEESSKTTYRKPGLVLVYRVGDAAWEAKQFLGKKADFGQDALWKSFGGSDEAKVVTVDDPKAGSKDALSAGGAYKHLPTKNVVTQEDGTVTIQLQSEAGEDVGEPITFLASTGGGGESSGTLVNIAFQKSPLYAALGAEITIKAAVRSLTVLGSTETENEISALQLINRDTNQAVWSWSGSKASSADLQDYSFEIPVSDLFTVAGAQRFRLVATDDAGHTGSKNITVTAEDVTVTCNADVQVLNVRADSIIRPTDTNAVIDLFKFANNQSDQGITALVEIYKGGKWEQLHKSVINDSFTHSINFNPSALGLTHGAYPIRISGTSVASGVKGNTVYSAIFVVDASATAPLVAIRYNDTASGKVKLFEQVSFEVAVYNPAAKQTIVNTKANNDVIAQLLMDNSHTYVVTKQIQGVSDGDTLKIWANVVNALGGDNRTHKSYEVELTVEGSVLGADTKLKEGALYAFDFASRSNDDADKSIKSGSYELAVSGANWRTNGFTSYLGQGCLRIAENVTAALNHAPFGSTSVEQSGMVFQMQFATNNIQDADALLVDCYAPDNGAGFYVKGNKVGIYCKTGTNNALEERSFECGKAVTLAVVAEPASVYVERNGTRYSSLRLYLDGDFVATIGYVPGSGNLFSQKQVRFDGTKGDLYIFYALAYNSYYEWAQAFKNYLVKLSDTSAMIKEYDFEDVLRSQTAEGSTQLRPSHSELWNRGIPYVIEVASQEQFTKYDGSDGSVSTSTKENFEIDLYYYDPRKPWRSFVARKVRKRRQGTTSAKRPKKNPRYYLSKASSIEPLFPDYTNADALTTYALFKLKKVRVGDNTLPVDLITIKIDYSNSGGANDCGVCDQMNATYRALGSQYMTPAQRNFDGTWDKGDVHLTGLQMNHSTANHPCAIFRSDSDTLQNVWFEAKGNWKEDKGEQVALGFKDTPGYNKGCLNYQDEDFVEFYGTDGETLDQVQTRFLASSPDTSKCYLLSLYFGSSYRFMRYKDGAWKNTTGSMKQVGGKWVVTGDVLNPVEGFEMITYQGLCWWRGVSSVADMMAPSSDKSSWVQKLVDSGDVSATTFPAWTAYFECMVDNDQLAIDYALGRKVPYWLCRALMFYDSCDPDKHPTTYADTWKKNNWKYLNPLSQAVYYAFTDYDAALDQQAKNGQPMFFLEDGCSVENGVYSDNAVRMYMNKVYDCDACNGYDNDGGCNLDPEVDPAKPTVEDEQGNITYANPWAGWNSLLWVVLRSVHEFWLNADGSSKSDLRTVVAAMRSCQTSLPDGTIIRPFSPDGSIYYFVDQRLKLWPKMVSAYDGIRKYIQYTATSDNIYFYALQGLGLTSLPSFIRQRWRIRDGYYQTGDFFSGVVSGRVGVPSTGAKFRITAAKAGYFGYGKDSSASLTESVFLNAGESAEFTLNNEWDTSLLYIYQADRLSMLDLSELSLSTDFGFEVMALVEDLRLGSATHTERKIGSYAGMSNPALGNLPFLRKIDIRRTAITAIDCSGCPRVEHINAADSSLQSLSLAQTSPINDIALPSSMTDVRFLGLPALTYTGLNAASGLRIPSLGKVQRLRIESSPKLNARKMLIDLLSGQASEKALSMLRFNDQALKGDASELLTIIDRAVNGMDSDGQYQAKPVMNGTYELTVIREQSQIASIEAAIDGITLATVIEAYIDLIDTVNAEFFGGVATVDTVTLDNIGSHLQYYNGESYDEYVASVALADKSIHDIIKQ